MLQDLWKLPLSASSAVLISTGELTQTTSSEGNSLAAQRQGLVVGGQMGGYRLTAVAGKKTAFSPFGGHRSRE